jgi:fibronectin-binding autotransporter adhesin
VLRRLLIITLFVCTALAVSSSVMAATRTWTGTTSALWSVAGNWGGTAPVAGDDLVFPNGTSNMTNTNDFPAGTNFNSLTFTGGPYTITGNGIALGTQIVMNVSSVLTNIVNLPISLAGARSVSFTGSGNSVLTLGGVISGTGPLTISGFAAASNSASLNGNNTYSGGTSLSELFLGVGDNNAFGTGTVTTNATTTINVLGHTLANALSVQGCGKGNNGVINGDGTLTGPVTLVADTCIGSNSLLTFTGAFSGNFLLRVPENGSTSNVALNGNSPGFTGTLRPTIGTLRVNGTFASATGTFLGNIGDATIGGSGTIGGGVTVQTTNHLAPGNSPGILNTGNLDVQSGSTYNVELSGTTAGSGYDQTNVTGTVTLGGTLNVAMGFVPANGDQFTIVNNDGADAVIGTFAGLAQGASFAVSGNTLSISYTGGTGNDVVLTVVTSVPTLPRGVTWTLAAALLGISALALRRRLA